MYFGLCFIIGFVLGCGIGIYYSKKIRQELVELVTLLNRKVDEIQNDISKKVDEIQRKIEDSIK